MTATPTTDPISAEDYSHEPPLFVDLDGTLVRTDVFWEGIASALRSQPLRTLLATLNLFRGRAALKRAIADLAPVTPQALPYRRRFLNWLLTQHKGGRRIVLTTAADQSAALSIATHLGIFEAAFGSDGKTNNSARHRLSAILAFTGQGSFDYCGNSRDDLPILADARQAMVVGARRDVIAAARRAGNANITFARPLRRNQLAFWWQALRPFHWLKNLLVLVPLITAFLVTDTDSLYKALLAALAMCLAASSGYLINDILDMHGDRMHPRKRKRPFAAGRLTAPQGFAGALALFATAAVCALMVNLSVLLCIVLYLIGTFTYSVLFKREPIVDVIVLAGLHTIRIVIGSVAIGVEFSFWLLAFSTFFFFSLALMKRCGELVSRRERGENTSTGRGYRVADLEVLQPTGIAASVAAVLVLALYVRAPEVTLLYQFPEALWLALVALMLWTTRAWFDTSRGLMLDDPLLYALKHRRGRLVLMAIVLSFGLAALWAPAL